MVYRTPNTYTPPRDTYNTELVDRVAPRWAWAAIDGVLSTSLTGLRLGTRDERSLARAAFDAMIDACEKGD